VKKAVFSIAQNPDKGKPNLFSKQVSLSDKNNADYLLENFKSLLSNSNFNVPNPYLELNGRAKEIVRARKFCCADISNFIKELENLHAYEHNGGERNFRICANALLSIVINEGPALRGEALALPIATMQKLAGTITTREENLVLNSEHTYTQRELLDLGVPLHVASKLNLKLRQN